MCSGNHAQTEADRLTLHRSLSARLGGVLAMAFLVASGIHGLTLDCARPVVHDPECHLAQWSAPFLLVPFVCWSLAAVAGLFDRRPYLQLDGSGIRFRWFGFFPWTAVEAAVTPGITLSRYVVLLKLRDPQDARAKVRRRMPAFLRFAYRFPVRTLQLNLFGTGFRSKELTDWINRRIEAAGSASGVEGAGPLSDPKAGAA